METGGTALAFSSRALMRQLGKQPQAARSDAPCFEVAFTTADVPQAVERALSAGAALVQPAKLMPWGQTVAYVTDLDGFLVEICTPARGAALSHRRVSLVMCPGLKNRDLRPIRPHPASSRHSRR
jgi:lactoylglutathione lyase